MNEPDKVNRAVTERPDTKMEYKLLHTGGNDTCISWSDLMGSNCNVYGISKLTVIEHCMNSCCSITTNYICRPRSQGKDMFVSIVAGKIDSK